MMRPESLNRVIGRLFTLAVTLLLCHSSAAARGREPTFDLLQIGARTYTNVTVTTRARSYIFIVHSQGLASVKVTDLPDALKEQLGYVKTKKGSGLASLTNSTSQLVNKTLAAIETPKVKEMRQDLQRRYLSDRLDTQAFMRSMGWQILWAVFGILLLGHLFISYCCKLICDKAGTEPGILIWLPFLQWVPLFRAAGMSGWWCLGLLVPILNLVPALMWPFKIAEARGKSVWVAILLLLPFTGFFAFLYLAFSDRVNPPQEQRASLDHVLLTA